MSKINRLWSRLHTDPGDWQSRYTLLNRLCAEHAAEIKLVRVCLHKGTLTSAEAFQMMISYELDVERVLWAGYVDKVVERSHYILADDT